MTEMSYFAGLTFPRFGINRKSSSRTDTHPLFYGLQYVHSGPLYLAVNGGKRYTLKGPLIFLTSPDANFCYGSPEDKTREHCFVCFEGPRVHTFLEKGLFIPAYRQTLPYIRPISPEGFFADMLELILLLQNADQHDLAVSKLESLLLQLHHQGSGEPFCSSRRRQLEQLAKEIMIAPEKEWDFTEAAAKMNVTLKHFRRLFLRFCGMPPQRFVLRQRILKAGIMLTSGTDSVKSIANDCGFASEFYFSRLFKKYMDVAPERYRKQFSAPERR